MSLVLVSARIWHLFLGLVYEYLEIPHFRLKISRIADNTKSKNRKFNNNFTLPFTGFKTDFIISGNNSVDK